MEGRKRGEVDNADSGVNVINEDASDSNDDATLSATEVSLR
jgi:hypothetical protein